MSNKVDLPCLWFKHNLAKKYKNLIKSYITFRIDNTAPNVILTDNDSDNVVKNGDIVVISAGFSESLLTSPTINIGQIVSGQPLSSSNPFNFNNYWNNNEPNSSCNSPGCNEDFGILGFSDSSSTNTQFGSLKFNDYELWHFLCIPQTNSIGRHHFHNH